jgi:hypothetical protein
MVIISTILKAKSILILAALLYLLTFGFIHDFPWFPIKLTCGRNTIYAEGSLEVRQFMSYKEAAGWIGQITS